MPRYEVLSQEAMAAKGTLQAALDQYAQARPKRLRKK